MVYSRTVVGMLVFYLFELIPSKDLSALVLAPRHGWTFLVPCGSWCTDCETCGLSETELCSPPVGAHTPAVAKRRNSRRHSGYGPPAMDWLLGETDIKLRTLLPGEGQFLPLAAMLNGSVYFTPDGTHLCSFHLHRSVMCMIESGAL
jgi:hypothetical protein